MTKQPTRILFTAAMIAAMVAPAAMAEERFDGVTLRIGTWGGAWRDSQANIIAKKFEELGGTIEYVTGSPPANIAKLIAARGATPPIDMVEILDAVLPVAIEADLLTEIDLSKVPNTKYLASFQYDSMKVASWSTQEGICYDVDGYKAIGVEPPVRYQDLAEPKLNARVIVPDITSGGGLSNFAGMSYAGGGDGENVQPALDMIETFGPVTFWTQGADLITGMQTGDILAGISHAGWCLRAKYAGVNTAFVHPIIADDIKGVSKDGWLGVVKGTPNYDAAVWYVNEFIDEVFQSDFAVVSGVVPVNSESLKKLSGIPDVAGMMELDPAKIAKELRVDYSTVDTGAWIDAWSRAISQ
jgi:spermidine/putrescine-binding protein